MSCNATIPHNEEKYRSSAIKLKISKQISSVTQITCSNGDGESESEFVHHNHRYIPNEIICGEDEKQVLIRKILMVLISSHIGSAMAAEIAREIGLDLGLEVQHYMEQFYALPKPNVSLYRAAANAAGRPLANLVELNVSRYRYVAVVELPQVQFSENEIEWTVNHDSEVTIEGQISLAAIFADKPMTSNRRNRVQLCPTEPWAISFYLPGPVDWWTASVVFTSDNLMEIMVLKRNTDAETSALGSRAFVPEAETSAFGACDFVPETETSAAGSRAFVPVADTSAPDLTAFFTVVDTSVAGSMRFVQMTDILSAGSTDFAPVAETSAVSSTTFVPSAVDSTAFMPAAETSSSGSTSFVPAGGTSASGSTTFVPAAETSAADSTAFVPMAETLATDSIAFVSVADLGSSPELEVDTLLTPSEIMHMVDGWFKYKVYPEKAKGHTTKSKGPQIQLPAVREREPLSFQRVEQRARLPTNRLQEAREL
ncbi:hypothetical protein L1987_42862 [Smallanthus sonchifolius]|uniref:Uncharacterized protein n=1 Tax=Smallanthus sonchifolius TaxID=185202 RepID=A0ACB9GLA7_9ASTR|nr:hypothetical protein L1987_42862 [Smallanthus sonchifolius]